MERYAMDQTLTIAPPPGFVVDDMPGAGSAIAMPELPKGFVLDQEPKPPTGFILDEPEVMAPGELGVSYPEVTTLPQAQQMAAQWQGAIPAMPQFDVFGPLGTEQPQKPTGVQMAPESAVGPIYNPAGGAPVPFAENIRKVYSATGIPDIAKGVKQLYTGTSPYAEDNEVNWGEEAYNRARWARDYIVSLGGRLGPKGLGQELQKEASEFHGFGPAVMPPAGDLGKEALEWGFVFPKLFKGFGVANETIMKIPRVKAGAEAIAKAGGIEKLAANPRYARWLQAATQGAKAVGTGAEVGGTIAAAEEIGKENDPLTVAKNIASQAAQVGGVALAFSLASSVDTVWEANRFRKSLTDAAYARYDVRARSLRQTGQGRELVEKGKGLDEQFKQELRVIDDVSANYEQALNDLKSGKMYREGQTKLNTAIQQAEALQSQGYRPEIGIQVGKGPAGLKQPKPTTISEELLQRPSIVETVKEAVAGPETPGPVKPPSAAQVGGKAEKPTGRTAPEEVQLTVGPKGELVERPVQAKQPLPSEQKPAPVPSESTATKPAPKEPEATVGAALGTAQEVQGGQPERLVELPPVVAPATEAVEPTPGGQPVVPAAEKPVIVETGEETPAGTIVYRGGEAPLDVTRGSERGISVSTDREVARNFAPMGPEEVVSKAILPDTAKLLRDEDIPDELIAPYEEAAKYLQKYGPTASEKSLEWQRNRVWDAQQKIVDYARANGYDAVEFIPENEIRVVRPGVLVPVKPAAGAAREEGAAGKEPWQMTRDNYRVLRTQELSVKWEDKGYEVDPDAIDRLHHIKVAEAIEQGKPVPPEVLADYPDLQKQAPITPEQRQQYAQDQDLPIEEVTDEMVRAELERAILERLQSDFGATRGAILERQPPTPTEIGPPAKPGEAVAPSGETVAPEHPSLSVPDNVAKAFNTGYDAPDVKSPYLKSSVLGDAYALGQYAKANNMTGVVRKSKGYTWGIGDNTYRVESGVVTPTTAREGITGEKKAGAPAVTAPNVSIDDISKDEARRAYSWNSMDPEGRGEYDRKEYVDHMQNLWDRVSGLAETHEQQKILREEFERYRQGYLQRRKALFAATSRTASSMVTGPANFPTAKNQKALNAENNRLNELLDWDKRAQAAIERKLSEAKTPEQAENEESEKLKGEVVSLVGTLKAIEAGEKGLEANLFKSSLLNKLKRSAEQGNVTPVQQALDLLRELQAKHLKKPAFTDTHQIWKLGEVAQAAQAKEAAAPSGDETIATYSNGVELVIAHSDDRVHIYFQGKPDEKVRNALKARAFKWSPTNEAWQRQNTENAVRTAREVLEKLYGKSVEVAANPAESTPAPLAANGGEAEEEAQQKDGWTLTKQVKSEHEHSSTQIDFPEDITQDLRAFGENIPDTDLYIDPDDPSYGRETESHVTVRYGMDTTDPSQLTPAFKGKAPITGKLGKVSLFETDKYDVVKVDVDSPDLRAANKAVGETVELPGETHKEYQPHVTIAYVKKGKGKKYTGNTAFEGRTFSVNRITLSAKDGKSWEYELTGKPAPVIEERGKEEGKVHRKKRPFAQLSRMVGTAEDAWAKYAYDREGEPRTNLDMTRAEQLFHRYRDAVQRYWDYEYPTGKSTKGDFLREGELADVDSEWERVKGAQGKPNPTLSDAISAKDFDILKSLLEAKEGNEANRDQFTRETGVTLPDSVAGTENTIGEWVRGNKPFRPDPTQEGGAKGEGGFVGVAGRPGGVVAKPWLTEDRVKSPDADIEDFFERTHILPVQRSLLGIKEWLKQGLRERFVYQGNMPNTKEAVLAKDMLRTMPEQLRASDTRAVTDVENIINNAAAQVQALDSAGLDLLRRKVFVQDLLKEAEIDRSVAGDFEVGQLQAESDRLDALMAQVPSVQAAYEARQALWERVSNDLFDRGVINEEAKNNRAYVRHFVLMYAKTMRRPLSKPRKLGEPYRAYKKHRKGYTGDISTDYLAVEIKALADIYRDNAIEDLATEIGRNYDERKEFARQAKDMNFERLVGGPENVRRIRQLRNLIAESESGDEGRKEWIEELTALDPTYPYRKKIAMFKAKLQKVIGKLPDDEEEGLFSILSKIVRERPNDADGLAARGIFKAIGERQKLIRESLGENYVTPERLAQANGYVEWWYKRPNLIYLANTITEAQMAMLVENSAEEAGDILQIPREAMRQALVLGGRRKGMLIPDWLAPQLDNLPVSHRSNLIVSSFTRPLVQFLKRWYLRINPLRYNVRNQIGDLERLNASGQTSALKYLPQAAKLLVAREGEAFEKAREYGAVGSSLWNEMNDPRTMREFERFAHVGTQKDFASAVKVVFGAPLKLAGKAGQFEQDLTQFREDLLRAAVYLKTLDDIQNNQPLRHWAGNLYEIEELAKTDKYRAAAKHSRETMVDYGAFTPWENDVLRNGLIPFYSYLKKNLTFWPRALKNAAKEDMEGDTLTAFLKVAAVNVPAWLIRVLAVYGLAWLWNHRDDEARKKEGRLGFWLRAQPHVNVGNTTLWGETALNDFNEWYGMEQLSGVFWRYEAGFIGERQAALETAKAIGQAPVNKLYQGLQPFLKQAQLAVTGIETYPTVFKPRQIAPAASARSLEAAIVGLIGADAKKFYQTATGDRKLQDTLYAYFAGWWGRPTDPETLIKEVKQLDAWTTLLAKSSQTGRKPGQAKSGKEADWQEKQIRAEGLVAPKELEKSRKEIQAQKQIAGKSDADLRKLLTANTYQSKESPSAANDYNGHYWGDPKRGQETLVAAIDAELAKRQKVSSK